MADLDLAGAARSRRWTTGLAEMVLRAFAESGKSRIAFAAEHGIHEQRLYQWQRRLASKSRPVEVPSMTFREVEAPAVLTARQPFELVLRTGMVLRIPASFDSADLNNLLRVLVQLG